MCACMRVCVQGCNVKDISYSWFMTSLSKKKKKREKENTTLQDVKDLHPSQESEMAEKG